jgi:translation initiation factor IF-3
VAGKNTCNHKIQQFNNSTHLALQVPRRSEERRTTTARQQIMIHLPRTLRKGLTIPFQLPPKTARPPLLHELTSCPASRNKSHPPLSKSFGHCIHSFARNNLLSRPTCINYSEDIGCTFSSPLNSLAQIDSRLWMLPCFQVRSAATKRKTPKAKDDNAPLLNEHLISELLTRRGKDGSDNSISAETYEVRLIVDVGRPDKSNKQNREDGDGNSEEAQSSTLQIVTINEAISIAHTHSLDLMEVSLKQDPPVIKALDFDRFVYQQKRKEAKTKDSKSAISDKPVKEFKFRAGIADHDLQRKASNMIEYLVKGHAVRVTLTARARSLREDAEAIQTTLDRVKDLVGDNAVEVRAMKKNERGSFGNLLLHPNLNMKK